ncbi:hypothetical protein Pelo_8107 [Pelomyxa schiedti]|nr:hypothetical protein Pelo_8107 [Pelomyxa schiedti]
MQHTHHFSNHGSLVTCPRSHVGIPVRRSEVDEGARANCGSPCDSIQQPSDSLAGKKRPAPVSDEDSGSSLFTKVPWEDGFLLRCVTCSSDLVQCECCHVLIACETEFPIAAQSNASSSLCRTTSSDGAINRLPLPSLVASCPVTSASSSFLSPSHLRGQNIPSGGPWGVIVCHKCGFWNLTGYLHRTVYPACKPVKPMEKKLCNITQKNLKNFLDTLYRKCANRPTSHNEIALVNWWNKSPLDSSGFSHCHMQMLEALYSNEPQVASLMTSTKYFVDNKTQILSLSRDLESASQVFWESKESEFLKHTNETSATRLILCALLSKYNIIRNSMRQLCEPLSPLVSNLTNELQRLCTTLCTLHAQFTIPHSPNTIIRSLSLSNMHIDSAAPPSTAAANFPLHSTSVPNIAPQTPTTPLMLHRLNPTTPNTKWWVKKEDQPQQQQQQSPRPPISQFSEETSLTVNKIALWQLLYKSIYTITPSLLLRTE